MVVVVSPSWLTEVQVTPLAVELHMALTLPEALHSAPQPWEVEQVCTAQALGIHTAASRTMTRVSVPSFLVSFSFLIYLSAAARLGGTIHIFFGQASGPRASGWGFGRGANPLFGLALLPWLVLGVSGTQGY